MGCFRARSPRSGTRSHSVLGDPAATQNPTDGSWADPGVRIAQFTSAFPHSALSSICDPSYGAVLGSVASQIGQLITPAP
jgi:hypothetical protein